MRFVHDQEVVLGAVIEQRRWSISWEPPGQMPGVIFDTVAIAHGSHHLQIKAGPLLDPLRLKQLAAGFERSDALLQFFFNPAQRPIESVGRD